MGKNKVILAVVITALAAVSKPVRAEPRKVQAPGLVLPFAERTRLRQPGIPSAEHGIPTTMNMASSTVPHRLTKQGGL
ncbi:hypothetical protein GX441_09045 [bacterium]|nr:hypothetical protein [bacterium]